MLMEESSAFPVMSKTYRAEDDEYVLRAEFEKLRGQLKKRA